MLPKIDFWPTKMNPDYSEMNTKLRVFEAFAGYGSQHIALDLLQRDFPDFTFEVVGIAEFDDKVSRLYNAAHNSQLPNFGDVTKINWGGMKCLILSYLHTHFLVKTSALPESNVDFPRVAALVPHAYGRVRTQSESNALNFCLWRM